MSTVPSFRSAAQNDDLILKRVKELCKSFDELRDELNGKFGELNGKFGELNGKFDELNGKFDELNGKFDELRKDISKLDGRMQDLEYKTRNIALPLYVRRGDDTYTPAQPITGYLDGNFAKREEDKVELGLFY